MLQKLEQAGFVYSPADRLRTLKVLGTFGTSHLNNAEQLKYRLAPILARSKAEQERFYVLFDAWLKSVQTATLTLPPPKPTWRQQLGEWLIPSIIVVVLLLSLVSVVRLLTTPIALEPNFDFQHRPTVPIGDTIFFENISQNYDTTNVTFHWEVLDESTGTVEDTVNNQFNHSWILSELNGAPQKRVRMIARHLGGDTIRTSTFVVECAAKPDSFQIQTSAQTASAGETIRFTINRPLLENETIAWSYVGGEEKIGESITYQFDTPNNYQVQAVITKAVDGYCQITETIPISIGSNHAPLFADKVLQMDFVSPTMKFTNWAWLLAFSLLLPVLYLWWRWFQQMKKKNESEAEQPAPQQPTAIEQRFAAPDKAPYFIPYRNRDHFVRIDPSMYRFANLLRQRQEGLREELDIPNTIKRTIERGGFLKVAFRKTTVPSEYLFLVDEQQHQSLQKQLFKYLIAFLEDKDIHLQVFYYEKQLHRLWNDEFPEGTDLYHIQRLYPHHRLIVLGGGHGLLKPYGGIRLTDDTIRGQLQQWRERLLLSPTPVASWGFKEQAIHEEMMAVFPADVEGFQTAMVYLEMDEEEAADQLPRFDKWEKRLLKHHPQPNINTQKWRRFETYQGYLADYPKVYCWLCAMAVHPNPSWELVLAIGRVLEEQQLASDQPLVTYDHLLLLSHIPWLQGQAISPRLREKLVDELDEDTRQLARQTIAEELDAVAEEAKGGHANHALQSELSIQQFLLAPAAADNQATIRYLLERGLINKKQRYSLEQQIGRTLTGGVPAAMMKTKGIIKTPSLEEYLADTPTEPIEEEEESKPFIPELPYFLPALITTLLFLLLLNGMWGLNGSEQLYQWTRGELPQLHQPDEHELYNSWFLQESWEQEAAVALNNEGVALWQRRVTENYSYDRGNKLEQDTLAIRLANEAILRFDSALAVNNGDYPLAAHNRANAFYNMGAMQYEFYFEDRAQQPSYLAAALTNFQQAAITDSLLLRLDALHGEGLVHFYQQNTLQADSMLQVLLELDSTYFERLEVLPHLESLLARNENIVEENIVTQDLPGLEKPDRSSLEQDTITQTPLNIDEILAVRPLAIYFDDDQPDARTGITTTSASYSDLVNQYLGRKRTYISRFIERLNKEEASTAEQQYDAFFERIVKGGYEEFQVFLKSLVARLDQGDTVEIELRAYNSPRGASEYNYRLSQRKIASVINDIKEFEGGVLQKYIDSGTLKITEIPFREERASVVVEDERNSIYSLAAALERRVEITEVSVSNQKPATRNQKLPNTPTTQLPNLPTTQSTNSQTTQLPLPETVFVKGGTFTMGCTAEQGDDCGTDEKPAHQVYVYDFYMGKYEVTNEQFAAFLNEKGNQEEGGVTWVNLEGEFNGVVCGVEEVNGQFRAKAGLEKHPMIYVSWDGARAYCNWLSEKTGQNYRLPTEAEWEYAARGGQQSRSYKYAGSNNLDEVAWYDNNSNNRTHPVGRKKANELGLYDMSGNVWEWCLDDRRTYEVTKAPLSNPRGTVQRPRVLRGGGSWDSLAWYCRSSLRNVSIPVDRNYYNGLRLVRAQ